MKKLVVLLIAIFAVLVSFTSVSAQEANEDFEEFEAFENVGVSVDPFYLDEVDEGEVSTRGVNPPISEWDVSKKGQYDFRGNAGKSDLYTNYYFVGKTSYRVEVKNFRSTTLKVELRKRSTFGSSLVRSWNVHPKATLISSPRDLDKSGEYFLRFVAPSEFSGNIR